MQNKCAGDYLVGAIIGTLAAIVAAIGIIIMVGWATDTIIRSLFQLLGGN